MKFSTGATPQGREVISLSPKLSATFSEGFTNQYNSPKTISAKGFIMSRTPYENPTLLPKSQKRDNSVGLSKSKTMKLANSSALETSTPTQKMLTSTNGFQRSSSKQKCETLRTVSSTPKNTYPYKGAESVRREDTSFNVTQYRWKKLEISTDFTNTKTAYNNKAQTTKHIDNDENLGREVGSRTSKQNSSVQKAMQNKNDNNGYNFYTEQNAEEKGRDFDDNQARTTRPLANYDNSPKTVSACPPQGPTKANHQIRNASTSKSKNADERESSVSKLSYRKEKTLTATPKGSGPGYLNESAKKKDRPLSAKKPTKEEQQSERASSKEPQRASLQSFVTKVNKGDVFSSIKKYGDKRDSSTKRNQKPQLYLDEKSSKPVIAVELDLKGSRTTPNVESKVFTINLGKAPASPAASTQGVIVKNTKKATTAAKEAQKTTQEVVSIAKAPGKNPFVYYMTHLERAHRWEGEPDYFVQLYQEHFLQTFQALGFCKALKFDPATIAQKKKCFPRRDTHKGKRTLVFDMDETLIHCNESLDMPADVILPIIFPNGEVVEAGINVRPYAIECLRELSQYFEIMVFTASHSCYANVVLDYLDPHEEFIHHRLFRESCVVTDEGLHIKDLRVIGDRNLQDLILVDNAAYSFGFQLENGIPIVPFYDNKADQELRHLIPYLKFLSSVKDLREINKQTFKLHHYGCYEEAEELLEKIVFQG